MQLAEVAISGYRSVKDIRFPMRRLTVLVGGNGVGKTNLYRSLQLVQAAAQGDFAQVIAAEGGLHSAVWAGKLRTHEKRRLRFEATLDSLYAEEDAPAITAPTYSFEVAHPPPVAFPAFSAEAIFKTEKIALNYGRRRLTVMERKDRLVTARRDEGRLTRVAEDLLDTESAFAALASATSHPEIGRLQQVFAHWRFFHKFRTDAASPLRRPCHAVTSPLLTSSGDNLAAVFATLRHIRGDSHDLDEAIALAFPGASLIVPPPDTTAEFAMQFPDFPYRQFSASELSDGTLQFLALMGALLSYRLPAFMALNEPENSLHPSVLPALGRVIARAAERAQILVVTHSEALASAIQEHSGAIPREVIKRDGATWLAGLGQFGTFADDDDEDDDD